MDAILSAEERVEAGAARLDEYWATHANGFTQHHWTDRIIPDELNIQDVYFCVLGQSFGSFRTGLIELGLVDEEYSDFSPLPDEQLALNFDLGFSPVGSENHTSSQNYEDANDSITKAWIDYLAKRESMEENAIQTSQPA